MRVFINADGKFYKAKEAKSTSDVEKSCVSVEGLAALSDVPITQNEWDVAIHKHLNPVDPVA